MSKAAGFSEQTPTLQGVQSAQLTAVSKIRDQILSYFQDTHIVSPAVGTLYRLMMFASERSQSISFLTSWGYIWDAEILLRPFTETCSKVWFICYTPTAEQPELVEEFWTDLEHVHAHQQRHKAHFAQSLASEHGTHLDQRIFEALRDDTIFEFGEQNKQKRKQLKQKWSFSEIIDFLDKRSFEGIPTIGFRALAHMYGLQSHLVHGDNKALDLMLDEQLREPSETKLKQDSQVCRIMSDQLHFWMFCQMALSKHFGREMMFSEFQPLLDGFENEAKVFRQAFSDSQEKFYSSYE